MSKKSDLSTVTDAFLEHSHFIKKFLLQFVKRPQDIDDIAQEAYLRVFKAEQDRKITHPKTLLFTAAKNIALNELKSKSARITDYIEECELEHDSESLEDQIDALDKLKVYCAAIDELPEQCRRVYLMRKVHGLPHKLIAEKLNITVRSVERHLQNGVIKCRAYLRKQGIYDGLNSMPKSSIRHLQNQGLD